MPANPVLTPEVQIRKGTDGGNAKEMRMMRRRRRRRERTSGAFQ